MVGNVEQRLRDLTRELAEGNVGILEQLIADQFFDHVPGPDEPTATERFSAFASDLAAAVPDLSISIGEFQRDGDLYRADLTLRGTHDGPLWGAPGTGRRIEWTNPISLRPVGDRFAVRFDDFAFPATVGLLRQLGLVNSPDEMDRPPPYPVSIPEFLLKVMLTGQAGDKPCAHLDQIALTEPDTRVCAPCFAAADFWPALRMCLICGLVGCCDTSKNKHMMEHHEQTGHALIRSLRMDEGWVWCYEDSAFFEKRILDRYR